jgi:hypothetical protein
VTEERANLGGSGSATLVVVSVATAKYRASTTFQSAPSA